MSFPNRYWCAILDEMRECYKTYNFRGMDSLVEELQIIGNRMEAGLDQKKDYFRLRDQCKALEKKKEKLEKDIAKLEKKKGVKSSKKKGRIGSSASDIIG